MECISPSPIFRLPLLSDGGVILIAYYFCNNVWIDIEMHNIANRDRHTEGEVEYICQSKSDPRRRLWLWHGFVCRFDIHLLPSEVLDSSCLSIGTFVNCIVLRVKVFIGIYLRIYLSTEGTVSIISSSPSPIHSSAF